MDTGSALDIVIIDDDTLHARHLTRIAATHHLEASRIDARFYARAQTPLAQLAIIRSERDTEWVRMITAQHPEMTTIVLGDRSRTDHVLECMRAGARDVLPVDLSNPEALARLDKHFGQCRTNDTARTTEPEDCQYGLAGVSPAMDRVRDFIGRLAGNDTTTLIEGPTGAGKELVALAIHTQGHRSEKPLVAVNCGAIPDDLLEGEFFGYEKGAFSGAVNSYPGKLALADGGTLFLDEIGELSMAGQVKLLRAIEARQCYRLGGRKPHDFDIRIVAATNRKLEDEVAAGRFRSDLFYRIAVARIQISPLAHRKMDIAPLARHFLGQMSSQNGKPAPALEKCAMRVLESHTWPGNGRELHNAMEVALINHRGGQLRAENFDFIGQPKNISLQEMPRMQPLRRGLTQRAIRQALVDCNGNKSEAARILGCSRMTLYRHLERT